MRGASIACVFLFAAALLFAFSCGPEAKDGQTDPKDSQAAADDSTGSLIAALQTGELEPRRSAAEKLCGMIGMEEEIIKKVRPLLQSENAKTREVSCYTFG